MITRPFIAFLIALVIFAGLIVIGSHIRRGSPAQVGGSPFLSGLQLSGGLSPSQISTSTRPVTSPTSTAARIIKKALTEKTPATTTAIAPIPVLDLSTSVEKTHSGAVQLTTVGGLSSQDIYQKLDEAVVQIVCSREGNVIIAGSGIIVSASGVVLSNAHVLENAKECIAKTGSPAHIIGNLSLLFIGNPADKIASSDVSREDFAFAKITIPDAPTIEKKIFRFLDLDQLYTPEIGTVVYAAAYPTELTGGAGLLSGGQRLAFTTTHIENVYRIAETGSDQDVIELAGSITTQQGSSGSPIMSAQTGKVVALVFGQTGSDVPVTGAGQSAPIETAKRTELAFLISYIDREIRKDKGMTLADFIASFATR